MASPTLRGVVRCRSSGPAVRRNLALTPRGHGLLWNLSRRALATAAMSDEQLSRLRVNQDRLLKDLHHSCQWGQGTRWGEYVDSLYRLSGCRHRSVSELHDLIQHPPVNECN